MPPAYPPDLALRTARTSRDTGRTILAWHQSLRRPVRDSEDCVLRRSGVMLLFCRARLGLTKQIGSSRGGAIVLEFLGLGHHGMHRQICKYDRSGRSLPCSQFNSSRTLGEGVFFSLEVLT